MAVKVGIAVALLMVAFFASADAAPYIQNPFDSSEPKAMVARCHNPHTLNIPAFVFNVRIHICQVTPSTCGSVKVRAGQHARINVGICRAGPREYYYYFNKHNTSECSALLG